MVRNGDNGVKLSPRQVQFMDLLMQGRSYEEIGQRLAIQGRRTIDRELANIVERYAVLDPSLTQMDTVPKIARLVTLHREHTGERLAGAAPASAAGGGADSPPSGGDRHGFRPPLQLFEGRGPELGLVRAALAEAAAGNGAALLIAGEMGIGKTAFGQRAAALAAQQGFRVLSGQSDERHTRLPYLPFRAALDSYAIPRPEAFLRDPGGSQRAAEIARWRLWQALTSFLHDEAAARPVLLMLEDLHWADPDSIGLLVHLARHLQGMRLLLLGTYRHTGLERTHPLVSALAGLDGLPDVRQLTLAGLDRAAIGRLAQEILGQPAPPETIADVEALTEGNPLFALELLRDMAEEQGAPLGLTPPARPRHRPSLSVPDRLRRTVARRFARLSQSCYGVLTLASVIGPRFRLETLDEVAGLPEDELVAAVEEALRAAILEEQTDAAGRVGYRFAHGFFQQVLYAEASAARRVLLHRRVAAALEREYGPRRADHAAELAGHLLVAVRPQDTAKAVEYVEQAARRAAAVYTNAEALYWHEQAEAALTRLDEAGQPEAVPAGLRVQLLEGRAAVEAVVGQFAAARQHVEAALARCEADDAPALRRRLPELCRRLARVLEVQGAYDDALACVLRGLALTGAGWEPENVTLADAPPGLDAPQTARLCLIAGLVGLRRASYNEAEIWAQRALALVAPPAGVQPSGGSPAGYETAQDLAQTYNLLGLLAQYRGRPREAEQFCRESAVRYEAIGDIAGREKALGNAALALQDLGDFAGALVLYRQSEELARRIGDPVRQAAAATNMGETLLALGEYDQAQRGFETALAVFAEHGHAHAAAVCRMNLTKVMVRQGDGVAALARADEAEQEFRSIGAESYLPEVARLRALALLLLGQLEGAVAAAGGSLARARALGRQLAEGLALRTLALARAALDGPDAADTAMRLFEQSRGVLAGVNAQYELGVTLLEQARTLAQAAQAGLGQPAARRAQWHAEAAALCDEAETIFRQASAARDLEAMAVLRQSLN